MADSKDWPSYSEPNQEWETYVKENLGGQKPDLGVVPDIPTLRAWLATVRTPEAPVVAGVSEQDHQVSTRDGTKITCRVYRPDKPPAAGSGLFVIFHGGGWCIGGLENEQALCRYATSQFGLVCVNVEYRLGPEFKHPTAAYDCHDAAKWAATNAASLGADPTKGFLLGGTSAGGNLTGVVALLLRDEGQSPPVTGCLYMIPAFVDFDHIPAKYAAEHTSAQRLQDAPILSRAAMDLFRNAYTAPEQRADPLFSPLLWPSGHAGLPPSAFQVCGADPIRDDAFIYERLLRRDHGIRTRLEVYKGLPHGFWSIAPKLEASKAFVKDSLDCVGWLLEQS